MGGIATSKAGSGKIEVRAVTGSRDERLFLELPYRLYRGSPNWVAPLRLAQKDILDTKRHPVYKTMDVEKFLAVRAGRVVGRVMAIINHRHNEFHGEKAGFFGFFEVEEDYDAARSLFEAARDWVGARGATVLRGPVNPSTNYECGLLVDAFDRDPAVMMTYNPPFYAGLIERFGFRKAMDLFAYEVDKESFISSDKLRRVADRLRKNEQISVRCVDLKKINREVEIVRRIYNAAWSENWGFVPVTEQEFEHLAKDLKQIVDPKIVMIAEQTVAGQSEPRPVGFFLAVPNINLALRKINGRLFPLGLPKLLWYSRKIDSIRIITMGVVKDVQGLGIAALFYDEMWDRGPKIGYIHAEMSWILENNVLMNRAARMLGGRRSKTYRIYEMFLTEG
jgi:hypothetical protein